MPISQSHILMLAAVSIFTGIIAPGVANEEIFRPYALTNMQYVAYGILALLALLFFCANFHMRRISMGLTFALIVLILSLAMMSVAGVVQSFSGVVLQGFAWGWIFLAMGLLLLFLSLRGKYETPTDEVTTLSEKILGIVGLSILLILTAFVVTIAEMNSRKQENTTAIAKMLDPSLVASASGVTLSVPFQHIDHFFLDRKRDMLSFIGTDSTGKSTLYPGNISIDDRQNIESTRFLQGRKFIIQKDGSILENGDIIGIHHAGDQDKNILFYQHPEGKYILLTDHSSAEYHLDETDIDLLYYQEKHRDLYWRSTTGEWQSLFKNGEKISDTFPSILRFAVSSDGNVSFIAENEHKQKLIVKDNTIIHSMRNEYVAGTLRMNGNDTLYAIKNDDTSFSVILNGTVLDRKLDEIREIFLEKNSSGFTYFGRPQGEEKYCIFTRYRGNLCGFEGYMNPRTEADGVGIIFAWLREGKWSIYRNTAVFVANTGYAPQGDISYDYFFFDPTTPRNFLFIQHHGKTYTLIKKWIPLPGNWRDFDEKSVHFGYNGELFLLVEDTDGWHILEHQS